MLQHNLPEVLFHDRTGHGGEADWSVVPRVLLITLFKNGCDVTSFTLKTGCIDAKQHSEGHPRGQAKLPLHKA